ncbi:MAG: AraC family transcriptional regulator [bacterium]|nr:AraC family transcriptional regulator [bacterium]
MDIAEYINGFALGYSQTADVIPYNDYHCENDYEIMYVRKGSRQAFVKEHTYNLTSGNLLFINKNTLHKTHRVSDEYERFVINFTDDYILPSIKRQMQILFEQRIYLLQKLSETDKLFFSIFSEWEKLRKGDNIAGDNIKCYINILLSYFIRNHNKYAYNDAKITNPSIERLIRYMNDNFKSPITLSSAAQMLHLSQSHLSRIFLKYTGFGFLKYLTILRIENGKRLLENTNMSVKQIAFECGFNDSNYFSFVFKTETGISPLQYKKQQPYK